MIDDEKFIEPEADPANSGKPIPEPTDAPSPEDLPPNPSEKDAPDGA